MNQPCKKCGRIVTVPDIPLPKGYTQKCTACGFANDVSAVELENSLTMSSEETWDATFDSTMDIKEDPTMNKAMASDERFREMEGRLRAEMERRLAEIQTQATASSSHLGGAIGHHLVRQGDVIICTQNTVLYQKCHQILSELNHRVEGASTLEKALGLLQKSHYQVIIIDQQFLNSGEAGRHLFHLIKETPTDVRRAQTVVLLTPGIASVESQVFYQWSMDLNVHPRDLDRLGQLVRQTTEYKESILSPLLDSQSGLSL